MSETRKVIVDGIEFEVAVEGEGKTWSATVEGKTFQIEIPDAAPVAKKKRTGGGKPVQFQQISRARLSLLKSMKETKSLKDK